MSESASSESGPLSVDQAIASLLPVEAAPVDENANQWGDKLNETPEAPIEAAEGEEIVGDQPAEDPDEGAETAAEGEEEPEVEAVEPLDAPVYWSKEAKAKFASLDPELQAVVLSQEGPREEATAKAKATAAAEVEKAQKELAGVQTLAQQLSEFLPQALKTFQQRWGEPDWVAVAQEHGAEQATVLKFQYDQEQKQLSQIQQAEQTAQIEARKATLQTEWKVLGEIAPDLTDPVKGKENREAVVKYLVSDGHDPRNIDQISAKEMLIARKAMLWDQAQAALKAPKPPKPVTALAQRAPVRPAAAEAQPSSQRTATQVANRFAQTRSVDDAVALLLARKA